MTILPCRACGRGSLTQDDKACPGCRVPIREPRTIPELQKDIHAVAVEKGWWPVDVEPSFGDALANIHGEVSEAWEDYRKDRMQSFFGRHEGSLVQPTGFWTEIADVVIRCLDLAEAHGVNLNEIIEAKHEFNKTRSFRHGGKKA